MSRPARSCAATTGRLRRGPDRREVADHEHGRRDDRSWKSEILAERAESRVAREGRRRIGDPFVRAVARLPVNGSDEAADRVRRHVCCCWSRSDCWGSSCSASRTIASRASGLSKNGPSVQPAPGRRPSTSEPSWRRTWRRSSTTSGPDGTRTDRDVLARGGPVRGRRGRADRGADGRRISCCSRRLRRTERSWTGSRTRPITLSRLLRGRRSSPSTRSDTRSRTTTDEEMLPLRADAEEAREPTSTKTPRTWRMGRGHEVEAS